MKIANSGDENMLHEKGVTINQKHIFYFIFFTNAFT